MKNIKLWRQWIFQHDINPKQLVEIEQGLASAEVLEGPGMAVKVSGHELGRRSMVEPEAGCGGMETKYLTQWETVAHEEWAKIPKEGCYKLVSSYA